MELTDYQTFSKMLEESGLLDHIGGTLKRETVMHFWDRLNGYTKDEVKKALEALVGAYTQLDMTVTGSLKV